MAQSSLSSRSLTPINQLPEEILRAILQQVVNESRYSSVIACLLCCRRWHDSGLPLLCSAIVLTGSSIDAFLIGFPPARCDLIRSLEVFSSERKGLSSQLHKLAAKMTTMVMLSTFSLTLCHTAYPPHTDRPNNDPQKSNTCFLRRSLVAVVKSLPKSCVDLQIDMNRCDVRALNEHLCDLLRQVLSRLHHFRVRVAHLCPAIFVLGNVHEPSTWTSVAASSLKTIVINCIIPGRPFRPFARACYPDRRPARILLVQSLRELVARGEFPAIERLWLIFPWTVDPQVPPVEPEYYRYDVLQNKLWTLPYHESDDMPLDDQLALDADKELVLDDQHALEEQHAWEESFWVSLIFLV